MVMTHVAINPHQGMATATKDKPALMFGTAVLDPDEPQWLDNMRRFVRLMKEVAPTVKVFAYLNKNLCCEVGYEQKYRDSVAMDGRGKPATSPYGYPGLFVPTLENSYGKAMTEVYKYYVENLDANIYLDDIINWAYVLPGDGDTTWDGCTVLIDPVSHAVTRKQSSPFLVVQPWMGSLIEYLKSKGKTAMGNGYLQTRTMLSWGIPCFVENGMGQQALISSHLGTPLAWAGYLQGQPGYEHAWKSLNVGGIPCTRSGDWNDHMFPITSVELHSGIVIGKERILTNRSGQFGWGDDSQADVYVFDGKGKRVEKPNVKEIRQGNKVLTELRMPSDYMAILVKKNTK